MSIRILSRYIVPSLIAVSVCACLPNTATDTQHTMTSDDDAVVKHDTFVEFKSQLGNTIVHPAQWTPED